MDDMIEGTRTLNKNIIYLIGISLQLYHHFYQVSSMRTLQEDETIQTLNTLYQKSKQINELLVKSGHIDDSKALLDIDESNLLYLIRYTRSSSSSSSALQLATKYKFNYVYFPSSLTSSLRYGISTVFIPQEMSKVLQNSQNVSSLAYTSIIDLDTENTVTPNNITISFPVPSSIDYVQFSEYFYKGIDIYDPNDEAITKKCFISSEFDYDLTQKHRRYHIYQNFTYQGINGSKCDYTGYEGTLRQLIMNCEFKADGAYSIGLVPFPLSNLDTKVYNLPMRCAGAVSNISSNIGFFIFLILNIIAILAPVGVYLIMGPEKKPKEKPKPKIRVTTESRPLSPTEVAPKFDIEGWCTKLGKNMQKMHPLTSLCYCYNKIFTVPFFVFEILMLFGFNALFYTDSMIEDKIADKDRDKFVYPLKNEFAKIIISIVLTLVLVLILKSLCVEICIRSLFTRRVVSVIIMAIFDLFLFYYCVVFCGVYVNAQNGWFYSGVWCLLFNWVIVDPLYVFVYTLLSEKINNCLDIY